LAALSQAQSSGLEISLGAIAQAASFYRTFRYRPVTSWHKYTPPKNSRPVSREAQRLAARHKRCDLMVAKERVSLVASHIRLLKIAHQKHSVKMSGEAPKPVQIKMSKN